MTPFLRRWETEVDLGAWSSAGVRPLNEDAYFLVDLRPHSATHGGLEAFFAVGDGRGCGASGETACRAAIEVAKAHVNSLIRDAHGSGKGGLDPRVALVEIFDKARKAVAATSAAQGANLSLTAVFMAREHCWAGHIGDNCAYILRGDRALPMISDYSRFKPMVSRGERTWWEVVWDPEPQSDDKDRQPSASEVSFVDLTLYGSEAILVCTDGVCSALGSARMLVQASQAKDVSHAARMLCNAALAASSKDNVTAVLCANDWKVFRAGALAALRSAAPPGPVSSAFAWLAGLSRLAVLQIVAVLAVIVVGIMSAWWVDGSKGEQQTDPSSITGTSSTIAESPGVLTTETPETSLTTGAANTSSTSLTTATAEAPVTTTLESSTTTSSELSATTTTRRTTTTTRPPTATTKNPPVATTTTTTTTAPPTTLPPSTTTTRRPDETLTSITTTAPTAIGQ